MVTNAVIEEAAHKLMQVYDPVAIYLFGSYAWGTPSEDSDLDFAVVVATSDLVALKRPMSGHLALANLDVAKDIIVYTEEEFKRGQADPLTLASKISRKGVCVYAKA
jgi:uncharacterized protein